jgi:hypothetical protein
MMKTGIEEGTFAYPKPVPFTYLVFRQKRRLCKGVVSCKRSTYVGAIPFVFHKML